MLEALGVLVVAGLGELEAAGALEEAAVAVVAAAAALVAAAVVGNFLLVI